MAIDKYVDSTASGSASGDDWTNAYATLDASVAVAAGAHIAVSKDHAQSSNTDISLAFTNGTIANPIKIICRDPADDTLSTGGSITTTGSNDFIHLKGNIYVYGITLNSDEDVKLCSETIDFYQIYESCTFGHGSSGDSGREIQIGGQDTSDADSPNGDFINCVFNPEANPIKLGSLGTYRYYGCRFNLEGAAGFTGSNMHGAVHRFEGCNFAGDANPTTLWTFGGASGLFHILNSKLPGAITTSGGTGTVGQKFLVENSDDGTITDPPLGLNWYEDRFGTIKSTLDKYRTGGSDDEEQANAMSWEFVSSNQCIEGIHCLESPPIARWVDDGSAITSTAHFAGAATMNDDDVDIRWFNPDQTAAPNATALPDFTTTRIADVDGTPAPHTPDSGSDWNGSYIGTKQQDSITYTPTNAGYVYFRLALFKPLTTLNLDPQVVNT